MTNPILGIPATARPILGKEEISKSTKKIIYPEEFYRRKNLVFGDKHWIEPWKKEQEGLWKENDKMRLIIS